MAKNKKIRKPPPRPPTPKKDRDADFANANGGHHPHRNDKEVKRILKAVGAEYGINREDSIKRFVNGDTDLTVGFWEILWSRPENKQNFNRIEFCHGCQKFELYRVHE